MTSGERNVMKAFLSCVLLLGVSGVWNRSRRWLFVDTWCSYLLCDRLLLIVLELVLNFGGAAGVIAC